MWSRGSSYQPGFDGATKVDVDVDIDASHLRTNISQVLLCSVRQRKYLICRGRPTAKDNIVVPLAQAKVPLV